MVKLGTRPVTLHLYDSASRTKRIFKPQDPKRVTLYVCGPTVYDRAHIGNFRPVIIFDVLFRLLRDHYGADAVVYVRNITDIDDKIIAAARDHDSDIMAITEKYTALYKRDAAAVKALPPTLTPGASAHIGDMLAMIETLERKGYAYTTDSGVFFDVSRMDNYGCLSGRKQAHNQAGARVAIDREKDDPADFALWKFAGPDEPQTAIWPSKWGAGRPGWHIECSAMVAHHLGETVDIHGGGIDLQFPHHENENAQSQCVHGKALANYWMHNGFLDMAGEKMSKSLGNVVLLGDLLQDWDGEVIRFAMLSGHYRAPLTWTDALLSQAKVTLDRLYGALQRVWRATDGAADDDSVRASLQDDLNTPEALAALSRLAGQAHDAADRGDEQAMARIRANFLAGGALLGLMQQAPDDWQHGSDTTDKDRIDALIKARQAARMEKNWTEADRIRDLLHDEGIALMDGKSGVSWRRF